MKIGIFGGCFNPPHNMHKNVAMKLIKNNVLEKIIYVPTGNSYNKRDLIDFNDRFNMVKLIVQDINELDVSNIGNSLEYQYTYQILDYFQNIYLDDDIYFICGSDNFKEFNTWKKYKYILENYKLIVIKRNNDNIDEILSNYQDYLDRIIFIKMEVNILSSTYLRKNAESDFIKDYLDENVYNYIKKKKLYIKC